MQNLNDKETALDMPYRSTTRKLSLLLLALAFTLSPAAQSSPPTGRYTHIVHLFATQMALAANPQTTTRGSAVVFVATLTEANGPGIADPTGHVTFTLTSGNGGQPITGVVTVQNGTATWTNTPPVGIDTVVVAYSGDLNYTPVIAQTAVTILYPGSPDFDFTLPTVTTQAGQGYNGTISVQTLNGFTGNVTFTVGQLPQGVTFTMPSSSIHVSGGTSQPSQSSSNLTVPFVIRTQKTAVMSLSGLLLLGVLEFRRRPRWRMVQILLACFSTSLLALLVGCVGNRFMQSNGTPPGTYSISITGTGSGLTHTHNLPLIVKQNGE